MIVILVTLSLTALVFFVYNCFWKRRRYPAGPRPLPLIGNLHELNKTDAYDAFMKWKAQYGPVFTCWFGEVPTVCLADYDTIYEALVVRGDVFGSRFAYGRMTELVRGGTENVGILDEGRKEIYTEQRRFITKTLRDFGMGRNLMEEKILTEVRHFIDNLAKEQQLSGSVEFVECIDRSIGSVIADLMFGHRYDEERTAEFRRFKKLINTFLQLIVDPLALSVAHSKLDLTKIPPFVNRYKRIDETRTALFEYMKGKIDQHEAKFARGDVPKEASDLIDAFLIEMHKEGPQEIFNQKMLLNLMFDLFSAGQETSANTIAFTVIYVLNNAEVLQRIREELKAHFSPSTTIQWSDRGKLPYMNAVINEGQRLSNLLPVNLFHRNTEEVVLNGVRIPAGTCILPQIACVMFDEKVFPEPRTFKPERFLTEGGELKKCEYLIPFSLGKRQCIGESMARMELFLFMANLFNHYDISAADPANPPSDEKIMGITAQAKPFRVIVSARSA